MSVILNRTKCTFYVKYIELLYQIEETEYLKAFYPRKKAKQQHEQLKIIYNWIYNFRPNYSLIDNDGNMSHNLKQKQALIDKIEYENYIMIKYNNKDYIPVLPELMGKEMEIKVDSKLSQGKIRKGMDNSPNNENKKEENSIESVEYFIKSIGNIESFVMIQAKKNEDDKENNKSKPNSIDDQYENDPTIRSSKFRIDINEIKKSIPSIDSLNLSKKKLKTTKLSSISISLNKNKQFYNSAFPSTKKFFFQLVQKKNKMKKMKQFLQRSVIESSKNKIKEEMQRTENKVKYPQVFNNAIKDKLHSQNAFTSYISNNYANINSHSQMSTSKHDNSNNNCNYSYFNNTSRSIKHRNKNMFNKKYFLSMNNNNKTSSSYFTDKSNTISSKNNKSSSQYQALTLPIAKQKQSLFKYKSNNHGLKISRMTIDQ